MTSQPVDGPAKLHAGHRLDRLLAGHAGAPVGYRNVDEHPLTAAHHVGRISTDEFAAGEFYRRLYALRARTGRDSTDIDGGRGGSGVPFSDTQVTAIHLIQQIEERLGRVSGFQWVRIVRLFCGDGQSARYACMAADITNPRETWAAIRLALSKLSAAIEGTRWPERERVP